MCVFTLSDGSVATLIKEGGKEWDPDIEGYKEDKHWKDCFVEIHHTLEEVGVPGSIIIDYKDPISVCDHCNHDAKRAIDCLCRALCSHKLGIDYVFGHAV